MSKLNQIQSEISQLDGARFQKLADLFLTAKGFENLNSLGSVVGKDKSKTGTPDAYLKQSDGNFIFVEYTTTETNRLPAKIIGDLEKCLDYGKTGIPCEQISKIIYCHNSSDLSPVNLHDASEMCRSKGVDFELFGLGSISRELLIRFPGIAKEILGIEIDTGQITPVSRFIEVHDKNALSAPLDCCFQFREDEIANALSSLEKKRILVFAGKPGVGKTKLAIETASQFSIKHPEYCILCIRNKNIDIFEDLHIHLSPLDNVLLIVDDANRLSGFSHVIEMLPEVRDNQSIKVIATVRDYALEKIVHLTSPIVDCEFLKIDSFSDEEIKQLAENSFGIKNGLYKERIVQLAKGNARIAAMICKIAKDNNTLSSINNIEEVYNVYFRSISTELESFDNDDVLRSAGLIALFRVVRKEDTFIKDILKNIFGVSQESFWKDAKQLHNAEVVDMYEDGDIVKVSDQILATYLVHYVFFEKELLKFELFLMNVFPTYREEMWEALNPVLNAFNYDKVLSKLTLCVRSAYSFFKNEVKQGKLRALMENFGFILQTEVFVYCKNEIENMTSGQSLSGNSAKPKSSANNELPYVLKLLGHFAGENIDEVNTAIELILNYLYRQPLVIEQIAKILTKNYGFQHKSYLVIRRI